MASWAGSSRCSTLPAHTGPSFHAPRTWQTLRYTIKSGAPMEAEKSVVTRRGRYRIICLTRTGRRSHAGTQWEDRLLVGMLLFLDSTASVARPGSAAISETRQHGGGSSWRESVPSNRRVDMMPPNEPMCECTPRRRSKSDLDTYLTAHAAIRPNLFLFAVSIVSLVISYSCTVMS